jgi:hypothetical protein
LQQKLRTSSEVKPRAAGRFRWTEKFFNEQEQSGILAQKLSICGNLREHFFQFSTIENAATKNCQVAIL